MHQLLQQASHALSLHDADTLERLVKVVDGHRPTSSVRELQAAAEVLRQQVAAAARHLEMQRRLRAQEQTWVR